MGCGYWGVLGESAVAHSYTAITNCKPHGAFIFIMSHAADIVQNRQIHRRMDRKQAAVALERGREMPVYSWRGGLRAPAAQAGSRRGVRQAGRV